MAIDIQDYINKGKRIDPGNWPINAPLVIPPGKRLAGSGAVEPINPSQGGTRLEPTFSIGRPDDPPIIAFQGDGLVCDLTLGRPAGADIFSPQPWLIYSDGGATYGVRNRVENVVLDRIWKGIHAATRDTIRNVTGQCLARGITADLGGDYLTLDNCVFEASFDQSPAMLAFMQANTVAFEILGAIVQASKLAAYACGTAFSFGVSPYGKPSGNFVDLCTDSCGLALEIDAADLPGVAFTNVTVGIDPTVKPQVRAVVTGPVFNGTALFNNLRIWSSKLGPIVHQGRGYLALVNSFIQAWDDGESAIHSVQGPLNVSGCGFLAGRQHVWCEAQVPCANVTGNVNLDGGSLNVKDDTGGRVVVSGNS